MSIHSGGSNNTRYDIVVTQISQNQGGSGRNKVKLVTILSITTIFFLLFALVSCTSLSGGDTPTDENTSDMITWQKTYGGSNDDEAYSIQQTLDEGYIVAGYTYSFGAGGSDVYILKLDSEGNL
ncbi:MAG: hypothetical protein ACPLEW_11000 [Pseudothermotoga sp.]